MENRTFLMMVTDIIIYCFTLCDHAAQDVQWDDISTKRILDSKVTRER